MWTTCLYITVYQQNKNTWPVKQHVVKIACDDKGTSLFTDLLNFSKIVKGVSKIKTVGGGGGEHK